MDPKVAHQEILRLKVFDNWIDSPEKHGVFKEYVAAISAAHNDFAGTYVISEWLARETKMPTPAHIRALAWAENEKEDARRAQDPVKETRSHCPTCRDSGITESLHAENLKSIAGYCSCSAGRRREYTDCSPGQCRVRDPLVTADMGVPNCCCAPWRVNESRDRLKRLHAKFNPGPTRTAQMLAVKDIPVEEPYSGDF